MERNRLLILAVLLSLAFPVLAVTSISDDGMDPLRMHIMGNRVQGARFNETVHYRINVINLRDHESTVVLEIVDIPDHWSASLTEDTIRLGSNTNRIVVLSVRAPGEGDIGKPGFTGTAPVGVRAAGDRNTSAIATLTILEGVCRTTRDGRTTYLYGEDTLRNSDVLEVSRTVMFDLTWPGLESEGHTPAATLSLQDARVGYYEEGGKIYLPLFDGNITFYGPGFGGDGSGTPTGATMVNGQMPFLSAAFPGEAYNYVLVIDPSNVSAPGPADDLLLSFSVFRSGARQAITAESLDGRVTMEAGGDSVTLPPSMRTTLFDHGRLTSTRPVDRSVIMIDSRGVADGEIRVPGSPPMNVLDYPNTRRVVHHGREIFIFDRALLDVDVELDGNTDGGYNITFSTVRHNVVRSFSLNTTTSLSTRDTFRYHGDSLTISGMDRNKEYDLTIVNRNLTTGKQDVFTARDVPALEDPVTFEVTDWERLEEVDDPPMKFSIRRKHISIHTGMTGEEIMDQFWRTYREDPSMLLFWLVSLPALTFVGLVGYQYFIVAAAFRDIIIEELTVTPSRPVAGRPASITARIRNKGVERKGRQHTIHVTFHDNFEPMGREPIDIRDEPMKHGEVREVSLEWTPLMEGHHMMNVSLDVDEVEVDKDHMEVHVMAHLMPGGE